MKHPWNIEEIEPKPEMVQHKHNRTQVFAWVQETFQLWYGDMENDAQRGQCVHWSHAACCVLRLCGYRSMLQVGSMAWPMAANRGENPTHFSYQWKPDNFENALLVAAGYMPELHAWVASPDDNLIFDFSTGMLKHVAETCHGWKWETADPPPFLWCQPEELPEKVLYRPHIGAMRYLYGRLNAEMERIAKVA